MDFKPSTNADLFDNSHHTSINESQDDYRSSDYVNRKSASFKISSKEKLDTEKLSTENLLDSKAKV